MLIFSNRYLQTLVFLFPVAVFLWFLALKITSPETYITFIQEDSAIEYAQVVFFFLASVVSLLAARRFNRHGLVLHAAVYGLLAIALLFVSLEEVSWGQRIIGYENPDFFASYNLQHETTIHNLDTVQPLLPRLYVLIGAYGAFTWILAWVFFAKSRGCLADIVNVVVPDWFISSYFFFAFFVYALIFYLSHHLGLKVAISNLDNEVFLLWRDQEPTELLLSLGFLCFAVVNYIRSGACLATGMVSRAGKS